MLKAGVGAAALGAVSSFNILPSRAATTVQLMSHRFPGTELFAERLAAASPDVTVNAQLMPFPKMLELATISLSSKADTIDMVYANEVTVTNFGKNGWLRPLNDVWEKFKAEFNLDDFPESVMKNFTIEGNIYAIPLSTLANIFFYRKDLFDEAGKTPPETIPQYIELSKSFATGRRAGNISCIRPTEGVLNEAHWYLNALADGWFDDQYKPAFNSERSVAALEAMIEVTKSSQSGFAAAYNDECTITLQQDGAAMGPMWPTRAASMDDPDRSQVVGKMDYAPLPSGRGRLSIDGYAISAFSKQDPEMLFRLMATALSNDNARDIAALAIPARTSLREDQEIRTAAKHLPATFAALDTALTYPRIPEWFAVGEYISRRMMQAITGEMQVKEALDLAATETTDHLKKSGYYKT